MYTSTATPLLLFLVTILVLAVATRWTDRASVVGIALEPSLHLALDARICNGSWRLEVCGVDCAWQCDGRSYGCSGSVVGHASSDSEELEEVVELAMNVAAHGDWSPHGLDVRFFHETLLNNLTQSLHISLWQVLASLCLLQPLVGSRTLGQTGWSWLRDIALLGCHDASCPRLDATEVGGGVGCKITAEGAAMAIQGASVV